MKVRDAVASLTPGQRCCYCRNVQQVGAFADHYDARRVGAVLAVLLSLAVAVPAPNAPIPRAPGSLAAALTSTTRSLRAGGWTGEGPVPRDLTYLALYHQRLLRFM